MSSEALNDHAPTCGLRIRIGLAVGWRKASGLHECGGLMIHCVTTVVVLVAFVKCGDSQPALRALERSIDRGRQDQ